MIRHVHILSTLEALTLLEIDHLATRSFQQLLCVLFLVLESLLPVLKFGLVLSQALLADAH